MFPDQSLHFSLGLLEKDFPVLQYKEEQGPGIEERAEIWGGKGLQKKRKSP